MLRGKNLWIILIFLLAALLLFAAAQWQKAGKTSSRTVRIWVNGSLQDEIHLGEEKDVTILQENGQKNIVHITPDGFYMAYSSCDNQLCVQQGEVNAENYARRFLGTHVICLPNRVDVEWVLDDNASVDAPDV